MTSISSLKQQRQAKRRARLEKRVAKSTERGTAANKRGAKRAEAGKSREKQDKRSAKQFFKANTAKEKLGKMDQRAEKKATKYKESLKGGGSRPTIQPAGGDGKRYPGTKTKGPTPTPYRKAVPENSGTMKPKPKSRATGSGPKRSAPKRSTPKRSAPRAGSVAAKRAAGTNKAARKKNRRSKK